MASAKEFQQKLNAIAKISVLRRIVREEILSYSGILRDMKESEFERGLNPDKSLIGSYRNISYSLFKESKNPLARGFVDLILTGAFINSAKVKSKGNGNYTFDFLDQKASKLISDYGEQIKGLNQDDFNDFLNKYIRPKLLDEIKRKLR